MKANTVKTYLLAVAGLALVLFTASCSKSSTNPNAAMIGLYYGNIGAGSFQNQDTLTITADGNGSAVNIMSKTSAGSVYTITAAANGNSLTVPSQTFAYYINTDSVSGSGSLSGSTLNATLRFVQHDTVNTLYFSGIRQ
jgi:hypothetical protein